MTIILRLQGLDERAGTEDIRTFFKRLHIPEGGVYIVGGHLRVAYIAFTTDKDAGRAMRYSGKSLKGSKVTLKKSSMNELEHVLKSFMKKKKSSTPKAIVKRCKPSTDKTLKHLRSTPPAPLSPTTALPSDKSAKPSKLLPPSTPNSLLSDTVDSGTAFLLGICTVLYGLQSSHKENSDSVSKVDIPEINNSVGSDKRRTPEQTLSSKPGYVRLFGLQTSVKKEEICAFFQGLKVLDSVSNVELGRGQGCLVKFASEQEESKALLLNQQLLGANCVEIRRASEKMWTGALQMSEKALGGVESRKPKKSLPTETINHNQKSSMLQSEVKSCNPLPSKKLKLNSDNSDPSAFSSTGEYTVKVRNLPKTMTKTEIKEFLGCPKLAHENVIHLLDKEGNRTDTAFLTFNHIEDYNYALNITGCHVGTNAIKVSSIAKMEMSCMLAKNCPKEQNPKRGNPNSKDPRRCMEWKCGPYCSDMPVCQEHASRCREKSSKEQIQTK